MIADRILRQLAAGPATARGLAAALGCTVDTARTHVTRLCTETLVVRTRGQWSETAAYSYQYSLTDAGRKMVSHGA